MRLFLGICIIPNRFSDNALDLGNIGLDFRFFRDIPAECLYFV